STAELAAITIMKQDPDIQLVRASAVKRFGNSSRLPVNADVHFQGEDPDEGPITRYTVVTHVTREPPKKAAD
ncbi:MAG: DUF3182 family protein, partial [Mesorhizobium sp.]